MSLMRLIGGFLKRKRRRGIDKIVLKSAVYYHIFRFIQKSGLNQHIFKQHLWCALLIVQKNGLKSTKN